VEVFGRETSIPPADRRPAGDATQTVDRGGAVLGTVEDTESGPSCASAIRLVGDDAARAQAGRALGAACSLLRQGDYFEAEAGLGEWSANRGQLRFGVFERSGVESSLRADGGRLVLELNASYLYEDATRAAPAIIHQLTLLADAGWPGAKVTAERALLGAQRQAEACEQLVFTDDPPRGCLDVEELLAQDAPIAGLLDAGYAPADG
jgi:hypothetical protein